MTNGAIANINLPAGKAEFNMDEAADVLGISSDELQCLVATRLSDEERVQNFGRMKFRPADLIMLGMVRSAQA